MVKKKMKIEYINSFGPPEYVELKDNNIGIVVSEKDTKGVELSDDTIDLFWQTMDNIDIWNWKSELSREWYPYLLNFKHDLQLMNKELSVNRILKTQTDPLQRVLLERK